MFLQKCGHLLLMKLTAGLNFPNILCTAFGRADPKSAKKYTDDLSVFFALLGSTCVKAVRRHIDEIDPRNLLTAELTHCTVFCSIFITNKQLLMSGLKLLESKLKYQFT